jgi:triosephosphate isomerase
MYQGLKLSPPFFEIGPKAYLYGSEVLSLAKFADEISAKYKVQIIFTPQYVDIPLLARETKNLLIFAQHMDALHIGRGVGSVLPEAIRAAGAVGVLLNHAEKPLPLETIQRTIQRADEVGLASMVCAGRLEDVKTIAKMSPNILLAESPELIGTGKRTADDQKNIRKINELVSGINPEILVLHGAGISSGQDVYEIISMGAQATGSTSGIIKAKDPFAMLEEMIYAVRKAWNKSHN